MTDLVPERTRAGAHAPPKAAAPARAEAAGAADSIELTVVVPTFNEAANVPVMVERLDCCACRDPVGSRLRR